MKQDPSRWVRWLPWVSLAAFTVLWLARWHSFPLSLDSWYHLLVARQIADAGGPITYEWWEHAPVGRVHLYPPMLHLLLAGLLNVGCAPIVAARLASVLIAPCLLLTIFLASRRLFADASVAWATLLMALVPMTWLLKLTEAMASGLA